MPSYRFLMDIPGKPYSWDNAPTIEADSIDDALNTWIRAYISVELDRSLPLQLLLQNKKVHVRTEDGRHMYKKIKIHLHLQVSYED